MMSLNNYKYQTQQLCEEKNWANISVEQLLMLLMEEVGELAGAVRQRIGLFPVKRKKANVSEEMLDVLSYIFQLSSMLNIDLNKAWEKHTKTAKHKQYIHTLSPVIYGKPELRVPLIFGNGHQPPVSFFSNGTH